MRFLTDLLTQYAVMCFWKKKSNKDPCSFVPQIDGNINVYMCLNVLFFFF